MNVKKEVKSKMVKFLTNPDILESIENIISSATKEIFIITPYCEISQNLLILLKLADYRDVRIRFIYGKDELDIWEYFFLKKLNNLELYFCKNLNSICYFNEHMMLITSMNLIDDSIDNFEMGTLIQKREDPKYYKDVLDMCKIIIQNSTKEDIHNKETSDFLYYHTDNPDKIGFCIRCRTPIQFNPDLPLCHKCLEWWVSFWNFEYQEKYCHECANAIKTSFKRPRCYTCWTEIKKLAKEILM